jgi:putative ABC transport system permease protein
MMLRRLTGMGAIATAALAVLVFGCVFAIATGPREALKTRTEALQQTLAGTTPLTQAITATTTWGQFTHAVQSANPGSPSATNLGPADLNDVMSQLHGDFSHGVVHLAPIATDWASMTSDGRDVVSAIPPVGGTTVKLEVSYRVQLTSYVRVVSGSLSAPSSSTARGTSPGYASSIPVVVTQQTARQFGLRVGSSVDIADGRLAQTGESSTIALKVAGIVAVRDPASAFWSADPTLAAPALQMTTSGPPFWFGGVFALPGEIGAVQQDFGVQGLNMQWTFPMTFGSLTGNQAQSLLSELQQLATQTPAMTGPLAPAAGTLTIGSGLTQTLTGFISAADSVDVLLWLLYVSLAVAGAVVLLLAGRMVALRRSAELTARRARGASLRQVAATVARGAAIGCVPGAVIAAGAAVLVIPGAQPGGWWAALIVTLVAVGAPAAVAAWQHRLPGLLRARGRGGPARTGPGRRRRRAGVRLVTEATAGLAAIGGIIVFRQQGLQPGGGIDLYTSAAPVLVAIPVVIVVLRVYPLLLRGLLKGAARGRGITGFAGLAQAARTALTPALPAFALVLAVTVAAFAGMVRDAVTRGEVNASWQTAGADATVSAAGTTGLISAAAQREIARVPGVERSAVVWESSWTAPNGASVTGLAVDPVGYAALVGTTQTWPAVDAGLLTGDQVLASPQALADFGGRGPATLTIHGGNPSIRVRVAGTLSGTPAFPGGAAFVLMPVSLVRGQADLVSKANLGPNVMLLAGGGIDTAALASVVQTAVPTASTTVRSEILQTLTSAPLQQGAFLLFGLAIGVAAGLGLAVLLLELALGARDREATLARLATMGLGAGQRARLVLLEVLPALIAAAVAAVACALALPRVVAPAIDLSVFTGSSASVPLTPDVASFALPLLGLAVVALVALTIEIRTRRRGVAAIMRGGD